MYTRTLLLLVLLVACSTTEQGDRMFFRSKLKDDHLTYLSRDRVPFRIDLPGTWVLAANPTYNHVVFRSSTEPRRLVNIFDYSDGLVVRRFYKSGFTEAQAIEEYYRTESEHHTKTLPGSSSQILSKDVEGPVLPNLLWSVQSPKARVYFLTMSKSNRLISISYQLLDSPLGSEEPLLAIFRTMQFPTLDQVNDILRTETTLKQ